MKKERHWSSEMPPATACSRDGFFVRPDTGYTGKTALFPELADINNYGIIIYVSILTDRRVF
ncbi:hypothetical protein GPL15_20290 [Clostridium sp. MCC353]|uniref:hypothetical protein n=1 Tax=Clostridium sp. MCC353 TaxID=2592646 RepID=UPI001C02CF95|nr:hypothetical protein [Clostridium sp. MCC353]MBT9778822.1 hypothetical protein [Clostridium sp. MCC353]